MRKSVSSLICVGQFCGPDIEEGTFHQEEPLDIHHGSDSSRPCPCPPVVFHGITLKQPDEGSEKNAEKANL